ncbi:MAG: bifunctional riboflavin kinase/FAD synthetase [Candidatus Cloacimonadales bacterium]
MAKYVLTMGNFDGVHLGHCKLLEKLHDIADLYGCEPLIVTYLSHPKNTLKKDIKPYLLTTSRQKIDLLNQCGFYNIELLEFTKEFAQMSPYEFLKHELIEKFHPEAIVLGYDTKFGRNKEGDYEFVKNHESEFNYKTYQVEPYSLQGNIISSSLIRELIKKGSLFEANKYLNRSFAFRGVVTEGRKLGRTLGYPTINLSPIEPYQLTPPAGIYLSQTITNIGTYYSVTNIGHNPTVSNNLDIKIESFILDFDQTIYGLEIETRVIKKIREEQKFASLEELKAAIANDVLTAKRIIDELGETI